MSTSAEKSDFFKTEMKWCGKLHSANVARHDPEHIQSLLALRRPQTGGELQHLLAAVNWMHMYLPMLAEIVSPLRVLLESLLKDACRRPKRVT